MTRVTLEDVARKAGVSTKTVSRVLNDEPNVAAKTLEKVKSAIATLNYVPHAAARSLSRGRAMAIGLVVGWPVNSPYSSTLVDFALKASMQNGYRLALFSGENGICNQIVQAYLGKQVDGIILDTIPARDRDLISQLNSLDVPYVVVNPNRKGGHQYASFVGIDDQTSAKLAVDYLIKLGHKSIGYITIDTGLNHGADRLRGYRQSLTEGGIPFREEWVFRGALLPFQDGFSGALHLLSNYKMITAIVTGTDDVAMGAISAIYQLGLKIPDDISVIGFDDIYFASRIAPPLTTIHQPIDEIASTAVKQLIKMIDDPTTKPVDIVLPTKLVVRETCNPLAERTELQ
jgi:DNA-binding LacI/PurR family transcriptional regulator